MPDEDVDLLMSRAVELVLAMMRSASTDKIRPLDWWARAKTALETGAAVAGHFAELVSVMGRKLEIEVTTQASADRLAALAPAIGDFEIFRRFCEEQALYVVAVAQSTRQAERDSQQHDLLRSMGGES